MFPTRSLAAAALLALAQPGLAQTPDATAAAAPAVAAEAPAAGTYAFDPEHSHILFSYDHMGFSTSTGTVRGLTGTLVLDPADPAKSSVRASFPLSGLKTVSAALDRHMMGEDFFKGAAPETAITFTSTAVQPQGADSATVTGDLTLNGVTRPVTLAVTLRKAGENPIEKKPAAGFEATTTLKRSDFGLGAFAPAVGDDVQVTIVVEALKG